MKTRPRAPVVQAAREARRAIESLARPTGEFDASRYFRGTKDLGFYNVGASRLRALARTIHREHTEARTIDDAVAFADALIVDRYLEVKAVGVELMACYRKAFVPRLLPVWKRWLANDHSDNWATTDAICGMLIGPLLLDHPRLVKVVAGWSSHRNMWVRRASAVGLIASARRGLALDDTYRVALVLHGDSEDLIQKAVGWTLREAGKADGPRLERYLRQHGPRIPRTTLRYAIERFPLQKRRQLLEVTKAR